MNTKSDRANLILSIVCAVLCIAGVGLALLFGPQLYDTLTRPAFVGAPSSVVKNPPVPLADFELTNQDSQPTRLSDLRGKTVMLFFGYTHCPDVCPVTIADFVQLKKKLGSTADQIAFVMVSLDGERDTPAVLKNYLRTFDPTFIALTGDSEKVRSITATLGANFIKQQKAGTQESYLIAHTAFSYLIDNEGRWRIAYPYGMPTDDIASDIQSLIPNP
jgi:protein SCO1/2